MATITIRELDDTVLTEISSMAKAHRRTVEEEIRNLLEKSAEQAARRRQLVELAESIAAMTPPGVPQTDSTELLRSDRNRDR
jgi:plasmid stability protein